MTQKLYSKGVNYIRKAFIADGNQTEGSVGITIGRKGDARKTTNVFRSKANGADR